MLLAYLDEFGHCGPFINSDHRKFHHHPVFGYAGFVIPAHSVRAFGGRFAAKKKSMFRSEVIAGGKNIHQWEKKGAEIFTTGSYERYPERAAEIAGLADYLTKLGGKLFFYGQVKPVGIESTTGESASQRSTHHLLQSINRLSSYADSHDSDILIFLDSVDLAPRQDAVASMAGHLYASKDQKLKRVVEVPMQLESHLYGLTQFADWIAAVVTRASHFHFTPGSSFGWAPSVFDSIVNKRATGESRIWLPAESRVVTPRALAATDAWHLAPAPKAKPNRAVIKTPKRGTPPPLLAGSVGQQNPELKAFYDTLREQEKSDGTRRSGST